MARIDVRPATSQEAEVVAAILTEAAAWLERAGMPLWQEEEVTPGRVAADVAAGLFFVAWRLGEPVGTVRFQLEDRVVWPDAFGREEAVYMHRLAVRRAYAGTGVSTALMRWAADRGRCLDRAFLRLDCPAARPRLRAVYESFGFLHHSDRQVGPYWLARYELSLTK